MSCTLPGLTLLACAAALFAQAPPAAPAQPPGLETVWDITNLKGVFFLMQRLLPLLDRLDTKAWEAKGASATYALLLQSSKEQCKALADGARSLARNPERLSLDIELFFRIQAVENMLGSLEEGIRKYQGAAEAQELLALEAENGENRDRLQRYIVNLAAAREQQFQVMDKEAQRCRGVLSTPARTTPGRKK